MGHKTRLVCHSDGTPERPPCSPASNRLRWTWRQHERVSGHRIRAWHWPDSVPSWPRLSMRRARSVPTRGTAAELLRQSVPQTNRRGLKLKW